MRRPCRHDIWKSSVSSFTSQASSSSIMQTFWNHAIVTRRLHRSQPHAKNGGVPRQMNLGSHVVGKVAWDPGGLQLVSMSSLHASRDAAATSCSGFWSCIENSFVLNGGDLFLRLCWSIYGRRNGGGHFWNGGGDALWLSNSGWNIRGDCLCWGSNGLHERTRHSETSA